MVGRLHRFELVDGVCVSGWVGEIDRLVRQND